jgi:predicted NAD-dependent protein-ADP-ribosyltransferase YbiA (DUF1768 family)
MKQALYQEYVLFMFHSGSKDTKPGKGTGETLNGQEKNTKEDFSALSNIPNWRKCLSNFDESPFRLDGLQWKSVEHFFQAQKFKTKSPLYYRSFTMDSESELSKQLGGLSKRQEENRV